MRRSIVVLCSVGPYHVPTLARVALFPIHLDPPTRQHRELFRLLLGAPDLVTPSRPPHTPATAPAGPSSAPVAPTHLSTPTAGGPAASGMRGRLQGLLQRHRGHTDATTPATAAGEAPALSSSGSATSAVDDDPISCGGSSPFWYMEAFATSLREDSQLAPFDDIILIPNTRGPVSLRQSTHLAALAVLATRGLAHVHVDFTALEHPDESMPIVYELVCKYTNSVLVHWLQDAYEMQNWSHFNEFKNTVPMLLLQTQSYPPRALERQRPLGSVSRLTSRQYHSPIGPYVRSPEEAEYYRGAERFIQASMTMRRRNPSPIALTGSDAQVDDDMRERYESASLVDRESDYFDDEPDLPPSRRRATDDDAGWQGDDADISRGTPPPSTEGRVLTRSPLLRSAQRATRADAAAALGRSHGEDGGGPRMQRAASGGCDRLGLSYADCAKGRWWNTPGGRGDDEVELSRAYWSSTSSSWLGGGASGATSALPEWMEEVGAADTKAKRYPHSPGDPHATANVSDPALAGADGCVAGPAADGASTAVAESDREPQSLDTVVSDDGFALAVEEQVGGSGEAAAASPSSRSEEAARSTAGGKVSLAGDSSRADAREFADEDARKRYLTREIEDVRKMLDGMLRPTATAAASADGARDGATLQPSGGSAQSSAKSPHGSDGAGAPSRSLGRAFGAYEAHHHDTHSHTRRRHRSVRQLIEELFPTRAFGPAASAGASPNAYGVIENGIREGFSRSDRSSLAEAGGRPRAVSSASIFNAAVKTSPTHLGLMQSAVAAGHRTTHGDGGVVGGAAAAGGGPLSDLYSWLDSPMVEVHPITRSTGADVRQALWEQDIHPSSILMDCVQRYMEGHGLYRDPRKATAASLYAGIGANDFSGSARGGGGVGGPGGQLGAAAEVGGAFRDPATAGGGSAGSGGSAAGSTIMDGRTGARRVAPRETSTLSFPGLIPRLELHYDRNNLLAREQYEKLRLFQCQDGEEPDLIVPIGGDGYMMHCIRKNWRRFIPFYGVNAGHVGYLLNDRSTLEELFSSPLKLHFTTMLYCQAEKEGDMGERMLLSELAFNDAWVERSSGQTALIRILVNGQERIRRLRGDGVLVSTAAGSTAYSQALGASPVPVGAPLIQVVGSNVVSPAQWRPAHLDQEDQVEFEVIDSTKRPCRCYVDSVDVGNVTRLLVRSSRVAGVTLAFSKSCDLQHKLYQMQFPKTL